MIKVETEFPLALDSPDYAHPWGTMRDNTTSSEFWASIEKIRKGPLSYLDLGCAGGGLVVEAHEQYEHDSVGLEGSDFWVTHMDETLEDAMKRSEELKINYVPTSAAQWKRYYNQRLFTCDISQPFKIVDSEHPDDYKKFDLITAWEVIEHIAESRLPTFFENVHNHLDDGIFIGTISTIQDRSSGVDLHQTVQTFEWWAAVINTYFSVLPWNPEIRPARAERESVVFIVRRKDYGMPSMPLFRTQAHLESGKASMVQRLSAAGGPAS